MQTESLRGKDSAFTADDLNTVINGAKAKYLEGVSLTVNGLVNGTPDLTLLGALGLVNPIVIDIGGTDEIRTRLLDLYALDKLWLGLNPWSLTAVTDNDDWVVTGLWVPCWFPPVPQDTKASFTFVAITAVDATELSATATMLDGQPRNSALHYTEFQKNTSGTNDTSFGNWDQEIDLVGDLIGLLIFQTTPVSLSVLMDAQTVREIQVVVEGVNKMHYQIQEIPSLPNARGQSQAYNGVKAFATEVVEEAFVWLPMIEPIPRGSNIKINMMAGIDAEAVRTLPVQAIPF